MKRAHSLFQYPVRPAYTQRPLLQHCQMPPWHMGNHRGLRLRNPQQKPPSANKTENGRSIPNSMARGCKAREQYWLLYSAELCTFCLLEMGMYGTSGTLRSTCAFCRDFSCSSNQIRDCINLYMLLL